MSFSVRSVSSKWVVASLVAAVGVGQARFGFALDPGSVSESFATDPVAGGRATVQGSAARFTYAPGKLTAHYDSAQPVAKFLIPLPAGVTLDQNTPFTFSATFTIDALSGFSDPSSFAGTSQLAFGLQNAGTANDRNHFGTQDAYDLVTVDYFPYTDAFVTQPTLGPVVVESPAPGVPYTQKLDFNFGAGSLIGDFLSTGVQITADTTYDPATHVVATTLTSDSPLYAGGPKTLTLTNDLDVTSLAPGFGDNVGFSGFNVNQLGLYLWDDIASIAEGNVPFTADVSFSNLAVSWGAPIPEPASLGLLAVGAVGLAGRRRR